MVNKERILYWNQFPRTNQPFITAQYEQYLENKSSIDSRTREIFDIYGEPTWLGDEAVEEELALASRSSVQHDEIVKANSLFEAVRRHGHLAANIFPIGLRKERTTKLIDPESYGLTLIDLEQMPVELFGGKFPKVWNNARKIYEKLLQVYTGAIAFEFEHVNNDVEREWLTKKVEHEYVAKNIDDTEQKGLLKRLIEVESFEHFLQKTFLGQKRFSIEGLDMLIPMLDDIVERSNEDRYKQMFIGMAHRGRLSVLAHVLGKPLDIIFSEFYKSPDEELVPNEGSSGMNEGWSGDVKYHFGISRTLEQKRNSMQITLMPNPSHLEYVNAVVLGRTRAAQDDRKTDGFPKQNMQEACNILIHGDAAFIGEGIVAETLNLSNLDGYKIGGSIHFIANNLLGFTTSGREGRSTRYASDLAKGFEIPIIHVNADDPIACLKAVRLAYEYQQKFHKDIVIDLVGYRRYGHNEMDEPRMTQPLLYAEVDKHPTVATLFKDTLVNKNLIDEDSFQQMKKETLDQLNTIYDGMKEADEPELEIGPLPKALTEQIPTPKTNISRERLLTINDHLIQIDDQFQVNKKLKRILERTWKTCVEDEKIDWALGEAISYGSILQEGRPIRLTGQDTERGTFAHRHYILHDEKTGETMCRLHGIDDVEVSFEIRNSPLSEAAVLGFEYGYSVEARDTLVIWEAQFGDFVNVAQVIIDQFIASGRAKWAEISSLVMLLPHGHEGQGPEHSSARPERFLQLVAENNFIITNVTKSAQLFHLLRRQARMVETEGARPLVVLTPKGLLRHPIMSSTVKEFTDGYFRELIQYQKTHHDLSKVTRLLIGSGKIMLEIIQTLEKRAIEHEWLEIVSLEQVYPFPKSSLYSLVKKWPNLKEIVWVQEEPRNMGMWRFVQPYLKQVKRNHMTIRYIGRPSRSSPAVGEPNIHNRGQGLIIDAAISKQIRSVFL